MRRLVAVLFVMVLAGCGGGNSSGSGGLAESDPKGAEACTALAQAFRDKDNTGAAVAGSMKAGAAAKEAKTPEIRSAVIDLGGDTAADPEKMRAACVEAGVDVPEVPAS